MENAQKQSEKIEVFDPPMCCSSGVCGPNMDKQLVQFSATLEWFRSQGIEVERFSPARAGQEAPCQGKISVQSYLVEPSLLGEELRVITEQ